MLSSTTILMVCFIETVLPWHLLLYRQLKRFSLNNKM